jgi:hypothetical protein
MQHRRRCVPSTHRPSSLPRPQGQGHRQHKARLTEFVLWHNADAILHNLLIAAVPTIFLAAMRNPVTGFGNVSFLSLLNHLHDVYGHITEKELEQNIERMRIQCHPPTAIESLFVQIEEDVAFTVKGLDEPTKPTVLRWAYEIISFTGRFDISSREWRHMDTNTKSWALFKSHFKAADRDIRSQATSGTSGYLSAPYAATNYATTREAHLLARLAASELSLAQSMSTVSITPTIDTAANISAITSDPPRVYCWTHGFCKNISHTSAECLYPGEGHQVAATATNMMGGKTTNFVPNPRNGYSHTSWRS